MINTRLLFFSMCFCLNTTKGSSEVLKLWKDLSSGPKQGVFSFKVDTKDGGLNTQGGFFLGKSLDDEKTGGFFDRQISQLNTAFEQRFYYPKQDVTKKKLTIVAKDICLTKERLRGSLSFVAKDDSVLFSNIFSLKVALGTPSGHVFHHIVTPRYKVSGSEEELFLHKFDFSEEVGRSVDNCATFSEAVDGPQGFNNMIKKITIEFHFSKG